MDNVKKILVALCLSEVSPSVFEQACQLARLYKAELIAMNVLNIRSIQDVGAIQSLGYEVNADEYRKSVKGERKAKLLELVSASGCADLAVRTLVRSGHPAEVIVNSIVEENADMVVIGAKGRSDLGSFFVGSVAEKVFRHSPVPVISWRDRRNK